MRNVSEKFVDEMKTIFSILSILYENCAVYVITFKVMV